VQVGLLNKYAKVLIGSCDRVMESRRLDESCVASTRVQRPISPLVLPQGTYRLEPEIPVPRERRHVSWTTDTVDNEHMNKQKSKGKLQVEIKIFIL